MSQTTEWRRTHTCGELRAGHAGQTVTLNGWVARRRDHKNVYFVDLRDRYGVTQVVLEGAVTEGLTLSPEDVLSVTGEVKSRGEGANADLDTGEIELLATGVEVLVHVTSTNAGAPAVDDRNTSSQTC